MVSKKVLVTGGGGFIGSWLSRSLRANGAHVTILVREEGKSRALSLNKADPSVDIVRGNVEDADFVEDVLRNVPFDVIFHLASSNDNRGAIETASRVFDANILGTWNILSGVRKFLSSRAVVVLASSAELSRLNAFPREQLADDTTLIHPYHAAKKCIETMGEMFFHQYRLQLASVRLPNVFGGGDQNFSRIIPSIIRDLLDGKSPKLWSENPSSRRYIYVEDVVDALLAVVDHLSSNRVKDCRFGFSPSPALTTTALLQLIMEECFDGPIETIEDQESKGLTESAVAEPVLTLESIGWREKIGVRRGLSKAIVWYREYGAVTNVYSGQCGN